MFMLRLMAIALFGFIATQTFANNNPKNKYQFHIEFPALDVVEEQKDLYWEEQGGKWFGWGLPSIMKDGQRFWDIKTENQNNPNKPFIISLPEAGNYTVVFTKPSGEEIKRNLNFEEAGTIKQDLPFRYEGPNPKELLSESFKEGDTLTVVRTTYLVSCGVLPLIETKIFIKKNGKIKQKKQTDDLGFGFAERNGEGKDTKRFVVISEAEFAKVIEQERTGRMPKKVEENKDKEDESGFTSWADRFKPHTTIVLGNKFVNFEG